MATEIDFTIDQYTKYTKTWMVYSDVAQTLPVDLSLFTGWMEVRTSYDTAALVLSVTSANSSQMAIDGPNGNVTVYFHDSDFSGLSFPNGQNLDSLPLVYDVRMTDASNNSFRIAQGTITVNRAVTR